MTGEQENRGKKKEVGGMKGARPFDYTQGRRSRERVEQVNRRKGKEVGGDGARRLSIYYGLLIIGGICARGAHLIEQGSIKNVKKIF